MKRAIWLCGLVALVAAGCSSEDPDNKTGPLEVDVEKTLIELVRAEGVPANGSDTAIVRVIARTKDGRVVPNRSIEARSSNPNDSINYVPDRTGNDGAAEIHVSATDVGSRVLTITVQELTLPQRPMIEFVPDSGTILEFVEAPTVGKAGRPLRPAVRVEVKDLRGNRVDTDAEITLHAAGAEPITVKAVRGVATFSNVVIGEPGENRLFANSPGMNEAVSDPIDIIIGDPATLRFQGKIEDVAVGDVFSVSVEVLDPAGNVVVGSNETVRLRLYSNPTGAVLEGTVVARAEEGVATFDNLVIRKASPGYQLTAAASGYQSAESEPFTIRPINPILDNSTLTVRSERAGGGKVAIANGHERIRIDGRIVDSEGNPLVGHTVTLSASGDGHTFHPGEVTAPSVELITSPAGTITAWISSTMAGPKTISLRVGELFEMTEEVTFEADRVSDVHTQLVAGALTAVVGIEEGAGIRFDVIARDANDNPVPGVNVGVEVSGVGGVVVGNAAGDQVVTDGDGLATFYAQSTRAEEKTVTVRMGEVVLQQDVQFFPGDPEPSRSVVVASTIGQEATVFTEIAEPFAVLVRDRYNNDVEGATVTFSITGGPDVDNAELTSLTAVTDENGRAETGFRLGQKSGFYEVSWHAGWEDENPHDVKLTAFGLPDVPHSLVMTDPEVGLDELEGTAGRPVSLTFQTLDQYLNPTGNAFLSFAGDGTPPDGAPVVPWTPTTNTAVTVSWTLKPDAGSNSLTVALKEAEDSPTAIDTLVLTAEGLTGQPDQLVVMSDEETFEGLEVTQPLPDKLHVKILDENENPVNGVGVRFTILGFTDEQTDGVLAGSGPPGSVIITTGAKSGDDQDQPPGEAWTYYTLGEKAGTKTIEVTVEGFPALKATFTVKADPAAPTQLVDVKGKDQTGIVGKRLGDDLQVKVMDPYDNPVEGVDVVFTVTQAEDPDNGGLGADAEDAVSVKTDADGLATTYLTLGNLPGDYQVVATADDVASASVTFDVVAEADEPETVEIVSGQTQTDPLVVGKGLTDDLVVRVKDVQGNLLEGVKVTFAGPAGVEFSESPAVIDTDVDGIAGIGVTKLPTKLGEVKITATTSNGKSATFTFDPEADEAANIEYVSGRGAGGAPQDGTVGTDLDEALVVLVTDTHQNPKEGASVYFRTLGAGPWGSFSTTDGSDSGSGQTPGFEVKTDEDGKASVKWKLPNLPDTIYNAVATLTPGASPNTGVSFSAYAEAGAPAKIVVTQRGGGDGKAKVDETITLDLEVYDHVDNALDGVDLTFTLIDAPTDADVTPASAVTAGGGLAELEVAMGKEVKTFQLRIDAEDAKNRTFQFDFELETLPGDPDDILVVSGDGQEGTVGEELADPIVVQVVDVYGHAVPGVEVTFAPAIEDEGSFAPNPVITDDQGQAASFWTLHTKAELQTATASFDFGGNTVSVDFEADAQAAAPAFVLKDTGDGASATVGESIVIKAKVEDEFNNPVSGTMVTFAVAPGTTTEVHFGDDETAVEVPTDDDGIAEATVFVGTFATTFEVIAVVEELDEVTFTLTSTPDLPNDIVVVSGDGQTGTAGQPLDEPLVFAVVDQFGNRISGETVTIAPEIAGQGSFNPDQGLTVDGTFETVWTLHTTAGNYTATAASGAFTVDVTAIAEPDAVAFVTVTKGEDGSATVGGTIELEVEVTDAHGNPRVGDTVTFDVVTGTSEANFGGVFSIEVPTIEGGLAMTTVHVGTIATDFQVTATVDGKVATFDLSATPDVADDIIVVSGDGQTGTAGQPLDEPLVFAVVDQHGNRISGETVTIAPEIAGQGSFNPDQGLTVDGTFETVWTLHTTAGNYTATASSGAFTVDVTAIAEPAGVGQIDKIAGDNGFATVGGSIDLEVQVLDDNGIEMENEDVTFEVLAGTSGADIGGLPTAVVATDVDGKAGVTVSVGTIATAFQVTATAGSKSVTFDLSARAGDPADISIVSGDAQVGTVGRALTNPIVVKVVDEHLNPVSGADVDFAPENAGEGSFDLASDATGEDGQVQTVWTLHTVPGNYTATAKVGALTVPFTATAEAGPADVIAVQDGDDQVGYAGLELTDDLVVLVTDEYGNPVKDVSVTFASADGTVDTPAATTAEDGTASTRFTPSEVGPITVSATIASGTTTQADFTVTALEPPASFEAVAGDLQRIIAGEEFANPVVVRVLDGDDEPIEGLAVSFTVTGGTIVSSDDETDPDGYATAFVKADDIDGQVEVTASLDAAFGIADVEFTLEAMDPLSFGWCHAVGGATYYEGATDLVRRDWTDGAGVFLMSKTDDINAALWLEFTEAVPGEPAFGFVNPRFIVDCGGVIAEVEAVEDGPAVLRIDGTETAWNDTQGNLAFMQIGTELTVSCADLGFILGGAAVDIEKDHFSVVWASGDLDDGLCGDPPVVVSQP